MIKPTKKSQIKTGWHIFDAKGQILGRFVTTLIPSLIGKNKPYFVTNLDCGDHVVVINALDIKVTGRKEKQKKYYNYSGYPGGLKVLTYLQVKERNPERIIESSVLGMLPNNKLRSLWMRKLHVFPKETHTFEEKFKPKEAKKEKNIKSIKSEVKKKE